MRLVPRKFGLGTAIVIVVLGGVTISSLLVNLTWWRTARAVSDDLVDTLSTTITDEVRRAWWERVTNVQSLTRTVADLLNEANASVEPRTVLLAASRYAGAVTWMVLVGPDDDAVAAEHPTPDTVRLFQVGPDGGAEITDAMTREGELMDAGEPPAEGRLVIHDQSWLETGRSLAGPRWLDVEQTPDGTERGIGFTVSTNEGVLASILDYRRFARLLGSIPVAKTGRSYVIGPEGEIVIRSEREGLQPMADLDAVAQAAGARIAARPRDALNVQDKARLWVGGERYAVGMSPLWFQGWQLAIIIPEAEFLDEIDVAIRRVLLGMAFFLVTAGIIVAVFARRFIANPVALISQDLQLVERFELEQIPHRPSSLTEIDRLSAAIRRMAVGLADFGKFIPLELVRMLVTGGKRAEPGGEHRELTVMFADLAGFTSLSERLGDQVVPIVGSFLELATRAIEAEGGTVDKYIGDAVMAFWGAPSLLEDHALRACRAAIAIEAGMRQATERGEPLGELHVRVGLHTGPAIVGNVGSERRLNYTALGDTVNLASRLESVNKIYGTTILASRMTVDAAGQSIRTREIDAVTVYGRQEPVRLFEVIGTTEDASKVEYDIYTQALAFYRAGRFDRARDVLSGNAAMDGPARWLRERCDELSRDPPDENWAPITNLDQK